MEHENKIDPLLAEIIGVEVKGPRPKEFSPPPPEPDEDQLAKFFEQLEFGLSTGTPTEPGAKLEKRFDGRAVTKTVGPSGWIIERDTSTGEIIAVTTGPESTRRHSTPSCGSESCGTTVAERKGR